jgi:hypothetical protein
MTIDKSIEEQARFLAADNRKAEPSIKKIYWFPHSDELRLVELLDEVPASQDVQVRPFYFRASPEDGLSVVSSIAMIRPEEFGKLQLPKDWGDWSEAIEL